MSKADVEVIHLFPTVVYKASFPKHVDSVREAATDALVSDTPSDELYPAIMSSDITHDERVYDFAKEVIQHAYNIVATQGYDMSAKQTVFESMWMQEHYKHSGMEQHVHNNGVYLVGFYFLDTPEGSSNLRLHDPRSGKIQTDIKSNADNEYTSPFVGLDIKAGDLIITNAWLPHSFTRHNSDEPLRFVHINIAIKDLPEQACNLPTVI
jgi:uncharacterized protein (TIGR02466 family)